MAGGDMARLFHRLTSFEPILAGTGWPIREVVDDPWIVTSFEPGDPDTQPPLFKTFPAGLPVLPLPRALPAPDAETLIVLGRPAAEDAGLDLAQLARLLHLSAGIVRTEDRSRGRIIPFRAAGSAGGRFPLEVYVVVPDGTAAIPPGVHAYRPVEHDLVQVAPPPVGAVAALVVTGIPWRTGWRYRERGYRHIFWDAGTTLSQQLALAASAGLPARLYTEFPDLEVRDLVGADGIAELPVAVVALSDTAPGWTPAERAVHGSVAESPIDFPLVTATHWAGISSWWGEPWAPGEPARGALPSSPNLNEVIYRRASTRRMDRARSVPRAVLETALAVSIRGVELPHFVAVHAVDGVRPGLYRWPDLSNPLRADDLRAELHRITTGQALAGDAAFVVIAAADLSAISDRRYRDLQLAAGLVEGRLHLAAFALGYGASGMTFLDSELRGFLEEDLAGMLFTCIGVPEYVNRPGGPPGQPVHVRQVLPRADE